MNYQLYNDKIWTLPLKCQNSAAVAQPFPAGGPTPAVTSSNPASLGASVQQSGSGYTLVLTPKVQVSPGLTVTVTNIGMAPASLSVDIVADPNLLTVVIDNVVADATTVPQNIPVAAGP